MRRLRFIILAIVFFAPLVALAQDGQKLMDRYVKKTGFREFMQSDKSDRVKITAEAKVTILTVDFSIFYHKPQRVRVEAEFLWKDIAMVLNDSITYFTNGGTTTVRNLRDTIRTEDQEEDKAATFDISRMLKDLTSDTPEGATYNLVGTDKVNGKECHVVEYYDPTGDGKYPTSSKLYFDTKTKLLVKVIEGQVTEKGLVTLVEMDFMDYCDYLDGELFLPRKLKMDVDGVPTVRFEVISIENNYPMTPELFAPPKDTELVYQ